MDNRDRTLFWDGKAVRWEESKYAAPNGWLGSFMDVNRSLKTRLGIAHQIPVQLPKGSTIVELGCGTARLLPAVVQAGAARYLGIDCSTAALDKAQANADTLPPGSTLIEFREMDAVELEETSADVCFSLGLLDWLQPYEIRQMLARMHCAYYFHSFSERRRSLDQLLHRGYVFCMYGHRTGPYVPQYYTEAQMRELFASSYGEPVQFFRLRALSFGTFVSRLPQGISWAWGGPLGEPVRPSPLEPQRSTGKPEVSGARSG